MPAKYPPDQPQPKVVFIPPLVKIELIKQAADLNLSLAAYIVHVLAEKAGEKIK